MAKRLKLGDIFKINTEKGDAYFQCIHSDKLEGEIIKVFYKLWNEQVNDIEDVMKEDYFFVGFPLKYAIRQGIVSYIDNVKIVKIEKPQFMRSLHQIGEQKLGWHIINTQTLKRELVEELNSEQKNLSPWGIWNDTLLKENLENGWRLENWE